MAKVRWGLLSTASIGRVVLEATGAAEHAEFVSVASRDADRARHVAAEMGLAASYGSYEDLLARADVDAIYVALPVSMHTEWTIAALQAGKHVLCEKPFAVSPQDADTCYDAAEVAGRLCIEGFMFRQHPQTLLARRLVSDGAIGRVALVRSALSVSVEPDDIRRSAALAGGALLDLGAYCVSASRLFAGTPQRVYAERVLDPTTDTSGQPVDLRITGTLRFPGDVLAHFDAGLDLPRRDQLDVVGTHGQLTITDPWLCRPGYIDLTDSTGTHRLPVDPDGTHQLTGSDLDAYRIEFESASLAIAGKRELEFGRADAVNQAATLAALRRSFERAAVAVVTPDGGSGR